MRLAEGGVPRGLSEGGTCHPPQTIVLSLACAYPGLSGGLNNLLFFEHLLYAKHCDLESKEQSSLPRFIHTRQLRSSTVVLAYPHLCGRYFPSPYPHSEDA